MQIGAPVDDGLIVVTCFNNNAASKRMKTRAAQNQDVVYPSGNIKDSHGLYSEDFAFSFIDQPANSRGLSPAVCASLSGYGTLEKQSFPNDEEMQLQAIMSKIRPIGVIPVGMKIEEDSAGAISVGVTGKFRHKGAVVPMPFGAPYKIRPPKLSEIASRRSTGPTSNDIQDGRATLVAEPVIPRSMFQTACDTMPHLNNYYNNKASYLKGMERNRENTDMWAKFCLNMGDFATTCGIHYLHLLMERGYVAPPLYHRGAQDKFSSKQTMFPKSISIISRRNKKTSDDVLGTIITATIKATIDAIAGANANGRQPRTVDDYIADHLLNVTKTMMTKLPEFLGDIDPALNADEFARKLSTSMGVVNGFGAPEMEGVGVISDEMKKLQVEFLNKVFLSGDIANYEFGTSRDGSSSAKDSTGRINASLDGLICKNQYNSWRAAMCSMADAYNFDLAWQGGVITVPCEKGGTWEGLHG